MNRIVFLALSCSYLIFFSGCGEKFPPDFPKVYPITVTVKDGETPLPKINVTFIPANKGTSNVSYSSAGLTREDGGAIISTMQGSFVKKGIPEGEFIVTLSDFIDLSSDITPEEKANMSREELYKIMMDEKKKIAEFVKKVPEVLCAPMAASDEERSPIRFTVVKGRNTLTIDVAEYK